MDNFERFYKKDPNTFSNYQDVIHYHIHTDFTINFQEKIIEGSVLYNFRSLKEDLEVIILDLRKVTIERVLSSNTELKYEIVEVSSYQNETPIYITLPKKLKINEEIEIKIFIRTIPETIAIQWLTKEQTLGKQYPYLFTQGEEILSRSFFPNQDTPSVKSTFTAIFRIEQPLYVAWTGLLKETRKEGNFNIFSYEQTIPIPSYLYALVAGLIEFKEISSRIGVYAEKELIEKSVKEFEDAETFLKIAEDYLTPYEWGRYDIVVLPLGFPMAGMENPNLTFVTPSLLAGDKSLIGVLAHEISHSWTGNLVTNSNWQNFWLNEGFTTFLERKIMKIKYGNELFCLDAYIGYQDLIEINSRESDTSTSLSPLVGKDISLLGRVQYEKGFLFLHYLEGLVGEKCFQIVLQNYVKTYKYKSVNYLDFKKIFDETTKEELEKEKFEDVKSKIDWNHWIFENGLPNIKFQFNNNLIIEAKNLAEKLANLKGDQNDSKTFSSFHTIVKMIFLDFLNDKQINFEVYDHINSILSLNNGQNDDVTARWFEIVLNNSLDCIIPNVIEFLKKVGRVKYLKPVYQKLLKVNRETAQFCFDSYKAFYNPYTVLVIDKEFSKKN